MPPKIAADTSRASDNARSNVLPRTPPDTILRTNARSQHIKTKSDTTNNNINEEKHDITPLRNIQTVQKQQSQQSLRLFRINDSDSPTPLSEQESDLLSQSNSQKSNTYDILI